MDGTLLDTEKLYRRFWIQAAADCGYELSSENALQLRSLGSPFGARLFCEWYGEKADIEAVRDRRIELMAAYVRENGIEVKPGAAETLTGLRRKGFQTAVVTASNPKRTACYLGLAGLEGLFDRVICASMVERGKPAPDIYLYACAQLKAAPEETLAVEDSPNGIRSAHAAGCRCIMIPDLTEPDEELSQLLFRRLDTLTQLLELDKEK